MNIFTHSQLLASEDDKKQPWIIDGLIKASSIGFVCAEPKVGKSFMTLHMAMSVASGSKFLGHFGVEKARKVLIVQEEDSHSQVIDRYKLLRDGHGTPEPAQGYLNFAIKTGFKLTDKAKLEEFRKELKQLRPELLIFDVLNKLSDGESAPQATAAMTAVEHIRRDFGCACLIVSHFRKEAANRGNQRMRGSSVLGGWSENSLFLSKNGNNIEVEVENKFAQTPNFEYRPTILEGGAVRFMVTKIDNESMEIHPIKKTLPRPNAAAVSIFREERIARLLEKS